MYLFFCFVFKQKTAYELRISDWSSVVCSSDLGLFSLEVGVALTLYYWVLGSANPIDPHGWLAAAIAIAATHLVTWGSVSTVMRLAGAPVTMRSALTVLAVAGSAAVAEGAVAPGAAGAAWRCCGCWYLLPVARSASGYFFIPAPT